MDFTFTDDQLTFREAVSRFLMTEAAPEMLREIWETDSGRSPSLRKNIAEQGLTSLSVPEDCGGLGMDDVAWALMTQELGYYAIPDSLADAAYVAAGLIAALPPGDIGELQVQATIGEAPEVPELPEVAGWLQEATSVRAPSTSTRQTRQAPMDCTSSR